MHRRHSIAAALVLASLLILTGCGRDRAESQDTPVTIRTPMPTFTPTPPSGAAGVAKQAAAPAPADSAPSVTEVTETPGIGGPVADAAVDPALQSSQAPAESAPAPAESLVLADPPLVVINTELVNSRNGPDISYPVVMVLGRGEEYDLTGKSADGLWFRVCCVQGKEAWVKAEFADTDGPVDPVPVAQAGEISPIALATLTATAAPVQVAQQVAEPPTATPQPPAQPESEATSTPAAAPALAEAQPAAPATDATSGEVQAADAASSATFQLVAQEQFPETNVVRVFLYAYSDEEALEGYSLRVTKDGAEMPVSGASFGGRAGLTWPLADDRQRFQNFKVEFPGVDPAGVWTVELTKDGASAGPTATFTLAASDPTRELYVRYKRP